jgi:hypothetical protein
MLRLVLGIAAAIGASSLYSLGVAFQAVDAREAPSEEHLRLALAWGLVKRSRWLLGTGLSMLGWPLQLLAVHLAPLVVVQPAMAVGLLVLLFAGERMLGERGGTYEHIAMAAIIIGVIGAGLCAPPPSNTHTTERLEIIIPLAVLGAASLIPYALKPFGRSWPDMTIICAGLAFGWSGVATKLASDDLFNGALVAAIAWGLSTAAASGVGMLSEMSSLQSRPAILVAPVVFVTQTVVPVVLAPTILEEHFTDTPAGGIPLGLSLALLIAGAAALARSRLLVALMEPQEVSDCSDSTDRPSEASRDASRSSHSTDAGEPSSDTTSTSPARILR